MLLKRGFVTILILMLVGLRISFSQTLEELKTRYDSAEKLRKSRKLDEAETAFKHLMHQFESIEAWEEYYNSWHALAKIKSTQSDGKAVIKLSKEAYDHCKGKLGEQSVVAVMFLRYIGRGFLLEDQKDSAIYYVEKSITTLEQSGNERDPLMVSCLNSLALTYKRYWDNKNALKYYKKSSEMSVEIFGEYSSKTAISDHNIGKIYNDGGQLSLAEDSFNKVLNFFKHNGDTNNLQIGQLYSDFGSVYRRRGWNQMALDYYFKALDVMIPLVGERHKRVMNTYRIMAYVYAMMGDRENALHYINTAVETNMAQFGKYHYETLNVMIAKGSVTLVLQDYEECIEICQYLIHAFNHENKSMQNYLGLIYDYLGEAQLEAGQYSAALETFQKSLDYCNSAFNFENMCSARAQGRIANSYSLLNEFDQSEALFLTALNEMSYEGKDSLGVKGVSFIEYLQTATARIANLYRAYDMNGDNSMLVKGLQNAENLRYEAEAYSSSIDQNNYKDFLKANHHFNSLCLSLYNAQYQIDSTDDIIEKVNKVMESSKSHLVLSNLTSEEKYKFNGVPDSLIRKERDLKSQLAEARGNGDNALVVQCFETLDSLKDAFKDYPNYYDLKYSTKWMSVNSIQKELLTDQDVLVHYFESDSSFFMLAVLKNRTRLFSFNFSPQDEEDLRKLLGSLAKKGGEYEINLLLQGAYDSYFKAIHQFIEQNEVEITNIHVIKDGLLSYLPFGLLKTSENSYLLEKYNINEHLSASVWNKEQSRHYVSREVLAVAPGFEASDTRSLAVDYQEIVRGELDELPGAVLEINQIKSLLPSRLLIGDEATEMYVTSAMTNYGMIHFATHAIIDNNRPEYSKLVLVGDSSSDGYLHSYELYNLRLRSELITLSACNTGFGKLQKGEGVMSLSRAFAYAGSPNLVMSLWPVNDESTAQLMGYFYQNLKDGMRKDEALRLAKLSYLENADDITGHPYYWAGFVFTGDPKPIEFSSNNSFWILIIMLFILGLIFFRLYKR